MPRNRVSFLSFLALVVLVIQAPMYAQLTAQLTGGIRDASGAVVPGASIIVVNEGTGIKWEAKSNQDGIFTVPLLQPGNYRVSVQAPGFRAVSRTGIQLEVAQTAAMDFTLDVGAATESITVTDSAPLLDSGSNAIGGLVTSEKVEDVPLLGRNSNALVTLVPGVRATRQTTVNPVLESHYQFFSINGSRPNQNQFMLDGGNNTNLTFNGPEYSPQVEEVQEFRIQTSSFSAEYANSGGGVINVVSKGGTNRFHGSLFEYFRHDKLTANDFFSNRSGRLRPQLRYNQFGATFGGPIVKNRTFFFFAYESLRQGIPVPATTSVPTPLQRTGDFSQTLAGNGQLVAIFNPWSTAPNPNSPGQFLREPFPGNRIPQSLIDPVAAKLETFYPSATTAGDPRTQLNNFFSSYPANRSTDNYSGRVDHQLNTSTMLMGRFSRANLSTWANPATFGASNIASPGFSAKPQHHPYALGKVTRTFTPTLFGEFLVSWARWLYVSYGLSNGYDPAKLGLPASLTLNSPVLGFPVFAPGEMSSLGGYSQALDISDRFEGKANLSKLSGKHTLKFGGMYGLGKYNTNVYGNTTGSYSFNPGFTQGPNPLTSGPTSGFGHASFLLGAMSAATHNPSEIHGDYRQPYFGFYFQDDFKITSRLTLNIGLRWEYEAPRVEADNKVSNFDFTSSSKLANGTPVRGGLLFPGVGGVPEGNWDAQKKNFAPRFGFAYQLPDGSVLRGGYGIFYSNSWGNGRNANAMPQIGFICSTSALTSLDNGLTPSAVLSNPFPAGFCKASGSSAGLLTTLGQQVYFLDRNAKQPYVQTWNFNLQRRLPADTVFEVAYSGSRGVHLMGSQEWNQLDPQYFSLGTQLNSQVPNPFFGAIPQGPLAAQTVSRGQLLRPYPQYLGVGSTNANYGESSYHAMLMRVEHRMSKGLSILAAYTVAKLIDNMIPAVNGFPGESFSGGPLQNFYNIRGERALASWDTPQTLVLSYVYELPFGRGKILLSRGGLLGKMVGGWQVNGQTTFMSGFPLQINGGNASGSFAGTQRPNWNGKDATLSGKMSDRLLRYFDTSAFSFNAPFTFGNAPRLMPNLRSPGVANFDMSLFKNTNINERFRVQFRAEAFNAFNRVQFGVPNTNINSSAFGVISSQQNSPRNFQLGLRLLF
jgi:hypothetical protein